MNILTHRCNGCKKELPIENFVKNKNTKTGYNYTCKACIKEYQLSIKDKLKAYQHEYQKKYIAEHKEKLKEYYKTWVENNKEKDKEYHRQASARYRAKKKQLQLHNEQ